MKTKIILLLEGAVLIILIASQFASWGTEREALIALLLVPYGGSVFFIYKSNFGVGVAANAETRKYLRIASVGAVMGLLGGMFSIAGGPHGLIAPLALALQLIASIWAYHKLKAGG